MSKIYVVIGWFADPQTATTRAVFKSWSEAQIFAQALGRGQHVLVTEIAVSRGDLARNFFDDKLARDRVISLNETARTP